MSGLRQIRPARLFTTGGTALALNGLLNMAHFIFLLNATSRKDVAL